MIDARRMTDTRSSSDGGARGSVDPPEPAPATPAAGAGAAHPAPPDPPARDLRKRPTGWIVACALLALVAIGCAVWAFQAGSDADDAEAALAAERAAQAEQEPATELSPELQARVDTVSARFSAAGATLGDIEQQLAGLEQRLEDARAGRADLEETIDSASGTVDAFRADARQARECLGGAVDAVGAALESGGPEAAVTQLEQVAGSCPSDSP